MSDALLSNIPNLLLMIRPYGFSYNRETAASNRFQQLADVVNVSERAQLEFDAVVQKLQNLEVDAVIFEDLRDDLPDSVFSNNWIAQLPDQRLTLFPMYTENRRAEVRPDIVQWLTTQGLAQEVLDLRPSISDQQFLEGTGSIVFDYRNKIAYACESPRTNIALFEAYCQRIGYAPVSFLSTDLNGHEVYHTNVVMAVGDQFAIVCLDSVSNPVERKMLELKLSASGHEVIPITFPQMQAFAGNCLEVRNKQGKSILLMSQRSVTALSPVQRASIEKYARIEAFEIPTIESVGGGSIRCMMTGLFA